MNHCNAARVELVIGPMFSGKTTELLRRARSLSVIGKRVLFVAHSNDAQRYNDSDVSSAIQAAVRTHAHDQQTGSNVIFAGSLMDLSDRLAEVDVVAVDEVQFFPDLVEFVLRHESRAGFTMLFAGLDGDSQRRPFGQTLNVIPLCDDVIRLHAYDTVKCDGSTAHFSLRLDPCDDVVQVGGSESYAAVARDTYLARQKR